MYRIGEFSYLCETTIKTLRHYHDIGLLEPAKIDQFTGYRYYNDSQVQKFRLIKQLQEAGLTLDEIKEIIQDFNIVDLEKKIVKLENEKNQQINSLRDFIKRSNYVSSSNVEFTTNKGKYFIGKFQKIKNRTALNLDLKEFSNHPKVFINYEKNYKEKDILCFVGYEISKEEKNTISKEFLIKNNLEIIFNDADKIPSVIHALVNSSIMDTYIDIIKFASDNEIQIRGEFYEIEKDQRIDIYVEAYDLKVENLMALKHDKYLEQNLKNVYPKEYVGTWKLEGEIVELPRYFDTNNEHYIPDTELKELQLNLDGTTNFSHITWKENYLIINYNQTIVYDHFFLSNDKKYLTILVNCQYSNARPYKYFYKKVK